MLHKWDVVELSADIFLQPGHYQHQLILIVVTFGCVVIRKTLSNPIANLVEMIKNKFIIIISSKTPIAQYIDNIKSNLHRSVAEHAISRF